MVDIVKGKSTAPLPRTKAGLPAVVNDRMQGVASRMIAENPPQRGNPPKRIGRKPRVIR